MSVDELMEQSADINSDMRRACAKSPDSAEIWANTKQEIAERKVGEPIPLAEADMSGKLLALRFCMRQTGFPEEPRELVRALEPSGPQ